MWPKRALLVYATVVAMICLVFVQSSFANLSQFDFVDFSLGCLTSFLLHEAGHWVVGNATGKLVFKSDDNGFPRWVYYGDREGLRKTASAGIVTDCLMREYYLLKRPKNDVWRGIFWYSIYHNLCYCFYDGGDMEAFSEASGVRIGTLHTILAAIVVLDLYRYEHDLPLAVGPKAVAVYLAFK